MSESSTSLGIGGEPCRFALRSTRAAAGETLLKQLQLLSERSRESTEDRDLALLTEAMVSTVKTLFDI